MKYMRRRNVPWKPTLAASQIHERQSGFGLPPTPTGLPAAVGFTMNVNPRYCTFAVAPAGSGYCFAPGIACEGCSEPDDSSSANVLIEPLTVTSPVAPEGMMTHGAPAIVTTGS